jgi:hypothetical protein
VDRLDDARAIEREAADVAAVQVFSRCPNVLEQQPEPNRRAVFERQARELGIALTTQHVSRVALQLVPGARRRQAMLAQQVGAIEQHAHRDVLRHRKQVAEERGLAQRLVDEQRVMLRKDVLQRHQQAFFRQMPDHAGLAHQHRAEVGARRVKLAEHL